MRIKLTRKSIILISIILLIFGLILRVFLSSRTQPKLNSNVGFTRSTQFKIRPIIETEFEAGKQSIFGGVVKDSLAKDAPGASIFIKGSNIPNTWFTYWNKKQELIFITRPSGMFIYQNDGSYPILKYVSENGTNIPCNMAYETTDGIKRNFNPTTWNTYDNPTNITALASDSFNRKNGDIKNTDGKGHQEANSGGGLIWTPQYGTPIIWKNRAKFSKLNNGRGVATIDTQNNDVYLRAKIYRSSGSAGLVWRYYDVDNYYRTYYDGLNIKTDKIVNGIVSNLFSKPEPYLIGQYLTIRIEGTHYGIFFGSQEVNGFLGMDGIILDTVSSGKYGIYTTDVKNSFDDFVVFSEYLPNDMDGSSDKYLKLKQVHIVGDSISTGKNGYQKNLQKLLGDSYVVIDHGIPKATIAQIESRFSDLVLTRKSTYVVILAGFNDIFDNDTPPEVIENYLQNLYIAAKNKGNTVIAVSLTPCNSFPGWDSTKEAKLKAVNNWIMNTAIGVDYRINVYPSLEDGNGNLAQQYDSGDHVHPSDDGYAIIGDMIYKSVPWR